MNGPEPIKANAERLSPEEAERLAGQPMRTVRAKSADPVHPREVSRARLRGIMLGAALAAGASVAAAVGYMVIWGRGPHKKRSKHV